MWEVSVDPDAPVDEDDDTPPFITFTTPADNAVGVQTAVTITRTFNEPIVKGTVVLVYLRVSSGSLQEEIDVTRSQITFISDNVIAIDPSSDLKSNTEYYVKMTQGSFKDKQEIFLLVLDKLTPITSPRKVLLELVVNQLVS